MRSPKTIIKPKVLRWARERTGLSVQEFAQKLSVPAETVSEWESGKTAITMKCAQDVAKLSLLPLGYLFSSEIPKRDLHLPDFRTINNDLIQKPSPELEATILEMEEKQSWFREYLIECDSLPLDWIGSISLKTMIPDAVHKIQEIISISGDEFEHFSRWEDYFDLLVQKIEQAGIIFIRNSVVGNNTRRPLSLEEFRGFVLVDSYAPLIFINGRDYKNPQMFTMIHELVHLILGQSGVIDISNETSNKTEKYCNKVAAEFLVPGSKLCSYWKTLSQEDSEIRNNIYHLSKYFKVSTYVIILRCRDFHLISFELASCLWKEEVEKFNRLKAQQHGGGGDFYANLKYRVGETFAKAIISELSDRSISFGDAFRLLNVKNMDSLRKLSEAVGLPIL